MKKKLWLLLIMSSLFALLVACSGSGETTGQTEDEAEAGESQNNEGQNESSEATSEVNLPDKLVMTTYDVGSSGYTQLTAISDAVAKKYGTQIRMIPSASGIGRLQPLKDGTAHLGGRVGDEAYFAFEGIEEFAVPQWGPQDIQYIYPILNHYGALVMEDSEYKTLADLKGKKIPHIIGNPSVNIKNEALLASVGLSLDDVEVVEVSSYAEQPTMMAQGQIDVSFIVPSAATVSEADELHGVRWLDLAHLKNDEDLQKLKDIYPFATAEDWDLGGALTPGEPVTFLGYTTYAPAVYGDADPDMVYSWLKAMDETYDVFKDASADMIVWHYEKAVPEPLGVPIHEGGVRFFKEKGMWNEEFDKKNDELHERREKLKEAWGTVTEEASEKGLSEAEFTEYWLERKAELVDGK
ncbi:hypothetical protein DCC39_16375 [Pueribacillus theae]|uniref:C4-dicarboxylate ABC transporter substrate-binding protein n=1 Tax=Pueribacillus theae TaxID=2171751 RepID=A0A2U1JRD0_9BACI|nr:TAXI family TRAP transporter solute-binding subunit [Pueribacillus theae]PWA07711.1 hypothetical protein DCC39_16375 [Pueribacillus theae]